MNALKIVGYVIAFFVGLGAGWLLTQYFQERDHGFVDVDIDAFSPKWSRRIAPNEAIPNLDRYREPRALMTLARTKDGKIDGLLHNLDSLNAYLDTLINFSKKHPVDTPLYWGAGFYPNIVKDNSTRKIRLNLYIIPTLYKARIKENGRDTFVIEHVFGYHSPVPQTTSRSYPDILTLRDNGGGYIFDEGHLWP